MFAVAAAWEEEEKKSFMFNNHHLKEVKVNIKLLRVKIQMRIQGMDNHKHMVQTSSQYTTSDN